MIHETAIAYLRMRRDLLLGAYGSPAEDYRTDWDRTEQEWRDAGCPIDLPLSFGRAEEAEAQRDAALAERDLLSTELRKSQEHTRLAMAERDALREKHARAARLFGLTELLTEPMECGHPIDCLPSHTAQEFREHPERIVCGWCAAEARAERARREAIEECIALFPPTTATGAWACGKLRALLAPEAQRPEGDRS